jgi:methionine synthase II (cobalamin-independent)
LAETFWLSRQVQSEGKELGLGAVNPRTDTIETPEEIIARVREAQRRMPAEAIFLNPDCGFGTFSARPMNEPEIAAAKLRAQPGGPAPAGRRAVLTPLAGATPRFKDDR